MPDLEYHTFPVGQLQCNCILIWDKASMKGVLIDAGGDPERIVEEVKAKKVEVELILATHGHFDHIGGIARVMRALPGSQVAIGFDDRFLYDAYAQQAQIFGMPITDDDIPPMPDFEITGDPELKFRSGETFGRAIHTPGHSPGSTCYYFPSLNLLSTGDTLFQQSVGRTDLWGSSFPQMKHSIQTKIYTLPGETLCIPGHGGLTKIHLEAKYNPFVVSEENEGQSRLSAEDLETVSGALAGSRAKVHSCRGCDALASWREAPPRI